MQLAYPPPSPAKKLTTLEHGSLQPWSCDSISLCKPCWSRPQEPSSPRPRLQRYETLWTLNNKILSLDTFPRVEVFLLFETEFEYHYVSQSKMRKKQGFLYFWSIEIKVTHNQQQLARFSKNQLYCRWSSRASFLYKWGTTANSV